MSLTKVSGDVIQDNIVVSGIVTASEFNGNLTGTASTATASATAYSLSGTPDIVVGTVTGNLTGNVTGNLTGNVNSVGVSTFTTLNATSIVGVNTLGVTTAYIGSINNGPLAGFRNAIINGNFDIWQRGTSFSNPGVGVYTADRWLVVHDGSGATRTISRQAFTLGQTDVPGEPTYFIRYAQTVGGSGGTFNNFEQRIEGVRSFAGQQVTISFYAKAASSFTLRSVVAGQNFGTGGSPSSSVFIDFPGSSNTTITTSWTKYSYTLSLPSISGKTLGSDNNDYLTIIFAVPLNSTFTFDIAQVQVEAGPVVTPFERRPIGTELALCQRYYQRYTANTSQPAYKNAIGSGIYNTASEVYSIFTFPTTMRSAPTFSYSNISDFDLEPFDIEPSTLSLYSSDPNFATVRATESGTRSQGDSCLITTDVNGAWFDFSSELS